MKACIKCGESKELTEFNKHPQAADGHINVCKKCQHARYLEWNIRNSEKRRAYFAHRNSLPSTKNAIKECKKKNPEPYKYYKRYPERVAAHRAVAKALRNGTLIKKPCEVCGDTNSEAHHNDYSKPLDVKWLCIKHHIKNVKFLYKNEKKSTISC